MKGVILKLRSLAYGQSLRMAESLESVGNRFRKSILLITALLYLMSQAAGLADFGKGASSLLGTMSGLLATAAAFAATASSLLRRSQFAKGEKRRIALPESLSSSILRGDSRGSVHMPEEIKLPQSAKLATDEDEIEALTRINYECFAATPYQGSFESKLIRNMAIFRACPESHAVLYDPTKPGSRHVDDIVYFTSVLPLTSEGETMYFEDRVEGDSNFDPHWVARDPASASCVLLFTVASREGFSDRDIVGSDHGWALYTRIIAAHVRLVVSRYATSKPCRVYFQNDEKPLIEMGTALGFAPTHRRTKDNMPVHMLRVFLDSGAAGKPA